MTALNPSRLAATNVLVGIDDTDNLESRGTGQLARLLVQTLDELELGAPLAATRHQLFVDPRIPYTSHNSSACIALDCGPEPDLDTIVALTGEFLEAMSADGSDPGLAVAAAPRWRRPADRARLSDYGFLAKRDVLDQATALNLARDLGIHLSPHGGDGGGVIGALAAVALHCSGADGRFLWMPRMRGLRGETTYQDLLAATPIAAAIDPTGREPAMGDLIDLGDWVRPVLREGRPVLLIDALPVGTSADGRWVASPREVVKSF
jgi:hypothetical protein